MTENENQFSRHIIHSNQIKFGSTESILRQFIHILGHVWVNWAFLECLSQCHCPIVQKMYKFIRTSTQYCPIKQYWNNTMSKNWAIVSPNETLSNIRYFVPKFVHTSDTKIPFLILKYKIVFCLGAQWPNYRSIWRNHTIFPQSKNRPLVFNWSMMLYKLD